MQPTITLYEPSLKRVRSRHCGAAAVEFAVVLPLLTMLLLGAADLGRSFHTTIAITNASRAGAEYGSMHPFDSSTQAAWQAGVRQAAADELGGSTLFNAAQLTVEASSVTESDGLRRVSVQATYPFDTIFHWVYIPASIKVQKTTVMRSIR